MQGDRIVTMQHIICFILFLVKCTGSFCSECSIDEDCRKNPDTANHQCLENVCRRCIADSHCLKGFKCRAGRCIIPRS